MNSRIFFLTLVFAGVWVAAYIVFVHLLLEASDGMYGIPGYRFAPFINAVWLVLLFPFMLAGEVLVPNRYSSPALGYALAAANALLWGWCAARLFQFVRRRFSRSSA